MQPETKKLLKNRRVKAKGIQKRPPIKTCVDEKQTENCAFSSSLNRLVRMTDHFAGANLRGDSPNSYALNIYAFMYIHAYIICMYVYTH